MMLVTCEHGGNEIPDAYRALFSGHQALLETHRGFDAGALCVARDFAGAFGAPLFSATTSRLLIDLNRSLGHPKVFSNISRLLPAAERAVVIEKYYVPYRSQVEQAVNAALQTHDQVIHISSHSFTPVLDGVERTADIGLLYDPRRERERQFSARWKAALNARAPALRVRRNYPYAGSDDGLTSHLRKRLPGERYLAIELEVNQLWVEAGGTAWSELRRTLVETLHVACAAWSAEHAPSG